MMMLVIARTAVAVAGGAALAWYAWKASSRSAVSVDSDGPMGSACTNELPTPKEWSVVDDDVDDQILPHPRSDETVENIHDDSRMASHEPLPPDDGGIIKIMTYNIWCLEDIKINKRMKAIGKLIQEHAPHIILLQEVTPMIYEIFQNCDWWGLYECSVSPKKAKRKYFCMLLSKLPMKKSYYKRFEGTATTKGLYVATITTRAKKKLVVATCHLKRPTPPETNSTERVNQANEALRHLQHSAPNVILGGDMNWDESSDGPFPLPGKWDDTWSSLRPEQDGWTFDTVSNEMLHHRRLLQKRLDRFICNLKDFVMDRVYMIGTEAIPNVTYGSFGKRLPVLPSDHYGLMLVIIPKQ